MNRPSLAAGNDPTRPFDVETDRRVAEFKVGIWSGTGTDAMRKRTVFHDLVNLAADTSGRRAELYVAGSHRCDFSMVRVPLRGGLSTEALLQRDSYSSSGSAT